MYSYNIQRKKCSIKNSESELEDFELAYIAILRTQLSGENLSAMTRYAALRAVDAFLSFSQKSSLRYTLVRDRHSVEHRKAGENRNSRRHRPKPKLEVLMTSRIGDAGAEPVPEDGVKAMMIGDLHVVIRGIPKT